MVNIVNYQEHLFLSTLIIILALLLVDTYLFNKKNFSNKFRLVLIIQLLYNIFFFIFNFVNNDYWFYWIYDFFCFLSPIVFAFPILYKIKLDKLATNHIFIFSFAVIPISMLLTTLIPSFRDLFFHLEYSGDEVNIKSSTLRYILFYYIKCFYLLILLIILLNLKKVYKNIVLFIYLFIIVLIFLTLSLEDLELKFLGSVIQMKLLLFFFITITFYFIITDFDKSFKESILIRFIFSLSPIKLFIGFIFLEIIVFQLGLIILNYIFFSSKNIELFPYTFIISFLSGIVITSIIIILIRFLKHYIYLLKKSNTKLKNSNRAKSLFMANISHEIRNPISGMVGISNILQNKVKDTTCKNYVSELIKTSNNLMVLIDDILDYSKSEVGSLKMTYSSYKLIDIINNSVNIFTPDMKQKNLNFHLKIAPTTPDFVYIDSMRLSQVLNNLLSNAIKFTDKGDINMSISEYKDKKYDYIKIIISDTGVGIKDKFQDKIFEKFFQINNPLIKNYRGSGLGLSISKAIVEKMGGNISFKSYHGKGSSFEFNFINNKSKIKLNNSQTAQVNQALSILIVEDDLINRTILLEHIKSIGHKNIELAENGKEALEKMLNKDYDIVFIDVQMPIMDGMSTIKNIKDKKDTLPIFAIMTANTSKYLIHKCKKLKVNKIIIKPFKKEEIQEVINISLTNITNYSKHL